MSDLNIQQRDAKELAAGYKGWFRIVEIVSIVLFWSLSGLMVYRAVPFMSQYGWLLVAAVAAGYIAADFVSGWVHWLADTWGSADMKIIGPALLRPFREHHVDQKAMTHHDYIETNGSNCMISVPVAALCAFAIPLTPGSPWLATWLFTMAALGSMIFWVMMTNQFHKWAHTDEDKLLGIVKLAQRWHLILPPEHHRIHHTAPYAKYYCITTGWLNWPLNKIGYYRMMERIITGVSGQIPRKDDIGLEAAVKIAPALDASPQPEHQKAH